LRTTGLSAATTSRRRASGSESDAWWSAEASQGPLWREQKPDRFHASISPQSQQPPPDENIQ